MITVYFSIIIINNNTILLYMSSFVFTIDKTVWNQQGSNYQYPVINTNGSFQNLATSFIESGTNTITVTISWSSYTTPEEPPYIDGLLFNTNVPYSTDPSIAIIQYGGIPLPTMTSFDDAAFLNFFGTTPANDLPTIFDGELIDYFVMGDILGTIPTYLDYDTLDTILNDLSLNIVLTAPYVTPDPTSYVESDYSPVDLF